MAAVRTAFRYLREAGRVIRQGARFGDKLMLFLYYCKTPFFFFKALITKKTLREIEAAHWRLLRSVALKNKLGVFYCGRSILTVYIANEAYEKELLNHFMVEGGTFVDVGAHIGRYSVMTGRAGVDVIAIEPESTNYGLLAHNIRLNRLANVRCVNKGVWSERGTRTIRLRTEGSGEHQIGSSGEGASVEVDTLDNIIGDRIVSLIKIDAEGSEAEAIKGATKTISNQHPKLVIEILDDTNMRLVTKLLEPFDYAQTQLNATNYLFV